MNCIVEAYMSGAGGESANSLRQISEQFSITLMKTRKILITAGVYHTELSEQVICTRYSCGLVRLKWKGNRMDIYQNKYRSSV